MKGAYIYFLLAFLLNGYSTLRGQELEIGSRMPSYTFDVYNYSSNKLKIADLKKKLVILEFWSHTCTGCLRDFPKLDSLQERFKDDIQIIVVNGEDKDSTQRFFEARKKLKKPNLPMISGDKRLSKLFPHRYVPFHVWLDSEGRVRYKASGTIATVENIETFLDSKVIGDYYAYKRIFVPSLIDSAWIDKQEYFSCISHVINGVMIQSKQREGFIHKSYNYLSVVELYKRAFTEGNYYPLSELNRPGRVVLEVGDSLKYLKPRNGHQLNTWMERYNYNYELMIPESRKDEMQSIMQADLKRVFNLNARIEKRMVNCLVLVKRDFTGAIFTRGGPAKVSFTCAEESTTSFDSLRVFQNQPFAIFAKGLKRYIEFALERPFVDATGLQGNIDMEFLGSTIDSKNLEALKEELKRYGLDLIEASWPLDVLVLSE